MSTPLTEADIERIVAERVSGLVRDYETKLADAEARVTDAIAAAAAATVAAPVTHAIPFNAGGAGTDVHSTWGQYYQELANRGELTDEHVQATR